MEGIVTETDDSHKKFVASRKQRSARIHSAIERLLQIKQANQTKIHDEKHTSRRRTEAHSRTRKTGSVQKHKGCNPRKITSKQVKELYEFYMKNKHKKRQKKMCVALSVKSEVPIDGLPIPSQHTGTAVQDTSAQQSNLPMSLQMLNAAAQAIPSTQSFTFPTGFSQMITLPDGTQQPAFFFIVNAPPNTAGVERENCKSSDNSVINPQVILQPVALNTTCPTAEKCTTDFSVIEKAMELASVRSSCTPANNEQPSPSQYPVGTESYKEETEGGCHSASNAPLETIALEDISVTVQTAESPMAAPSSELVAADTTNTLDVTPINNLVSEIRNQGIIINRPHQNLTVPQKPCMKYKPSKFCEATTQTGAKEAIPTLANTMVEKARIEGVLTLEAKKEKEGVAKKQAERVRRHPCTVCNKLFFTNHDLKRHKLTHSNERPFMCDICKKTFRTQNELKLHTPIHSDTTPYQCEYCGKEFRTKGCIKSHIKYHIGDKRHKCLECGRAFVKSADLKRHMAGHKNEKNFKCEECGSAFTRRDNLKAHMLLHSRNGVVTCDLCNKEFINEVYLKRHMHIHKLAKKKPYECQWCPKTYEQLEGLRRHIRQHVGDEKFVCKQCDKKFITSIQLKRHLWLTHEHDSPYRRSIL